MLEDNKWNMKTNIMPITKTSKQRWEIIFKLLIPLFLKINISALFWNFMKKNWVVIKIINGNISYKIDGKFRIVRNIGKATPTSSVSLKNFISSKIFRTNTKLL